MSEYKEGKEVDEIEERKPNIARVPRPPTTQEWNDHMAHCLEHRDCFMFLVQGAAYRINTAEVQRMTNISEVLSAWIGLT